MLYLLLCFIFGIALFNSIGGASGVVIFFIILVFGFICLGFIGSRMPEKKFSASSYLKENHPDLYQHSLDYHFHPDIYAMDQALKKLRPDLYDLDRYEVDKFVEKLRPDLYRYSYPNEYAADQVLKELRTVYVELKPLPSHNGKVFREFVEGMCCHFAFSEDLKHLHVWTAINWDNEFSNGGKWNKDELPKWNINMPPDCRFILDRDSPKTVKEAVKRSLGALIDNHYHEKYAP